MYKNQLEFALKEIMLKGQKNQSNLVLFVKHYGNFLEAWQEDEPSIIKNTKIIIDLMRTYYGITVEAHNRQKIEEIYSLITRAINGIK